jgi:hypothetical protein
MKSTITVPIVPAADQSRERGKLFQNAQRNSILETSPFVAPGITHPRNRSQAHLDTSGLRFLYTKLLQDATERIFSPIHHECLAGSNHSRPHPLIPVATTKLPQKPLTGAFTHLSSTQKREAVRVKGYGTVLQPLKQLMSSRMICLSRSLQACKPFALLRQVTS